MERETENSFIYIYIILLNLRQTKSWECSNLTSHKSQKKKKKN